MNERKVLNVDILEAALKVQVNIFELQYLISPLRNPSARLYLLLKRTWDKFFYLTESDVIQHFMALIWDERCLATIDKIYFEMWQIQLAIIQDQ